MSNQAKEITEELRNAAIDEINAARTAAGLDPIEYADVRNIGNNGYGLGQEFHLTGVVSVQTIEVNGKKAVYPALETEEGIWLSLARLMGLTSLKGYLTEGSVENWAREKRNSEPVVTTIAAEVSEDFDFDATWKPQSRDLYTEYAILKNKPEIIRDKTATYKGIVVHQLTAKKDSKDAENGWKKGDKRAMTAQMWTIE